MYRRVIAASAVLATLPFGVLSELITVTEYASTCAAIYTQGSTTATVVQSTVTVSPVPFTDEELNRGLPFIIEVQPSPSSKKRKRQGTEAPNYLMADGYISSNNSDAATFMINNGTLTSTTGSSISTNGTVDNASFGLSVSVQTINTLFFAESLIINWDNAAFSGGAALFFLTPIGNFYNLIAHFNGPIDPIWIEVILIATNAGGFPTQTTPGGVGSTSIATVISMGSMTMPYTASTSTNTSPSASASLTGGNISPEGLCGLTNGFDCFESPIGTCCSSFGFCGFGPVYCGRGCQTQFGNCDPILSSPVSEPVPSSIGTSYSQVLNPSSSVLALSSPLAGSPVISSQVSSAPNMGMSSIAIQSTPAASSFLSTRRSISISGRPSVNYTKTLASTRGASFYSQLPTISTRGQSVGPINPRTNSSTAFLTGYTIGASTPSSRVPLSFTTQATSSSRMASLSVLSSVALPTLSFSLPSFSLPIITPSSIPIPAISSDSLGILTESSTEPSASIPSESSVVLSVTNPSDSSTIAAPSSTVTAAICPDNDGLVVTDDFGQAYTIGCGADTNGDGVTVLASPEAPSSYRDCASFCDARSDCLAWTWSGLATGNINGVGAGNCYLKGTDSPPVVFDRGGGNNVGLVSGIKFDSSASLGTSSPTPESSAPATSSIPAVLPSSVSSFDNGVSTTILASSSSSFDSGVSITASASPSISSIASSSTSYLVLPSPTPCDFGDPPDSSEDDSYCEIDLPAAMFMYSSSDTRTFASNNGFISLSTGSGLTPEGLQLPDSDIPQSSVCPFFQDLLSVGGQTPQQGIFYQLFDYGVEYEFYEIIYPTDGIAVGKPPVHFTVQYNYTNPGVFTYTYYQLSDGDNGQNAIVGMQGVDSAGNTLSFTYSDDEQILAPGLVVTCDTNLNTCTSTGPPA